MGVQVLACYSGRVRIDKNERKDARHRTVVDPGVHRAALNDDITGLQMHDLAAVELQIALSREQQCIIDRLGAMHEFWSAGREFGDPDNAALASTDLIVAGDKPVSLRGLARLRIVDRHPIRRPDFAPGDVWPPQPADRGETLIGLDDGLAVRVMSGDDPSYFQSHGFPPPLGAFERLQNTALPRPGLAFAAASRDGND